MSEFKTVYLAGKITGDPNYRGKFERAAMELERSGYIVLNPALLPPAGFEYAAYMRMSRAMLDECEAICLLPDWTESAGALDEYPRSISLGIRAFEYADWANEQERMVTT